MSETISTALVTGGSSGIGGQIRDDLLAAGYRVISLDRDPSPVTHERLITHQIDLADVGASERLARTIAAEFPVTTLIHNAGVIRPSLMADVLQEDLRYLTALHLGTLIAIGQAVLPAMKMRRFGRIIVISSRAVLGLRTRTSYAATKAAQIGLVRTWALELGEFGITVNAIAPGPVITAQFRANTPVGDPMEQKIAESLPVKRIGRPKDISRVATFLAAAESDFITGQTLYVCGGASLGALQL
jgi:3-oxoacyl-[acyl-carrier protein] reductase